MGILDTLQQESTISKASGNNYQYVVLQVVLKEKFIGTGSGNLTELEKVINEQAAKGYRLHTISTTSSGSNSNSSRRGSSSHSQRGNSSRSGDRLASRVTGRSRAPSKCSPFFFEPNHHADKS